MPTTQNTTKLIGHEAIAYAEATNQKLNKYADPTEGSRDNLSVEEAREVAMEDPTLIWIDVDTTATTKTLKIKTICNMAASAAHNCLTNSAAKIGQAGNIRIVEITDIPETATDADVLKAWNETSDVSWLGNGGEYARHSFAFSEIGNGRILR